MRKTLLFAQVLLRVLFLLSIILFWISNGIGVNSKAQAGIPLLTTEYNRYYTASGMDFAVAGDTLYVLFDSRCELQCFDLQGKFKNAYSFKGYQNGRSILYCDNSTLYLKDREYNYYAFQDGLFLEYFDHSEDKQAITDFSTQFSEDKHSTASAVFYKNGASIWRESDAESVEVIHRPFWTLFFQNGTPIIFGMVCFFLSFILSILRKKLGQ